MKKPIVSHHSCDVRNLLTTFIVFLLLSACNKEKPTITIAVASNFETSLKTIIQLYKKDHENTEITIVSASSGTLTNQILNHAPFDLFLSADTQKPQLIYQQLKLQAKPQIYAIGKLTLWIPNSSGTNCLEQLGTIKTLAIANPKTAPYGTAAQEILDENTIKVKKIIQTANVSQAYSYSKSALVEAGFVANALIIDETQGCKQLFESKKINQSMILLNEKARLIYNYILSNKVQNKIQTLGYHHSHI